MPTVLIAPDKFKGSLPATEVCTALAEGIRSVAPEIETDPLPIADGGDGTVDAALAAGFTERVDTVSGPTGAPVRARWALRGTEAVLELAETSGLRRLPGGTLDHARAHTRGLGELILAARDAGATDVLVGIGGSASTDAGAGMLQALGAHLDDTSGNDIPPGHDALDRLAHADIGPARAATRSLRIRAACDVTSPLLGPDGAAAVFGPQKGLDTADVEAADARMTHAAALLDPPGTHQASPGAGAAGGTGFGLYLLGARFVSGAGSVLDLLELEAHLAHADLLITGEGHLDAQTLTGKGPAEVARRAQAAGIPVWAVAGAVSLTPAELEDAGITRSFDLLSRADGSADAIARARELLVGLGKDVGHRCREFLGTPVRPLP